MGDSKTIYALKIAFLFGFSVNCAAGNDNFPLGARSAGVATASVTYADIWSSANNQAGLAYLEKATGSFYYENRWNVKGLAIHAGNVAIPVKSTVIGLNYRHFGYTQYNETKIGLAVAKRLWEKVALGVQMDYFHTYFSHDYGRFHVLSGEIGLLCEPVDHLIIGVHLFNVVNSRQKANPHERIPTVMRFGLAYHIRDMATVSVETEKYLRMKAVFKAGLEFAPVKHLSLRCGVSDGWMYQYAFGVGYEWKRFTIDLAFSHHRLLGYSPHFSLVACL
ncbi:MAG: hypothetical protein LBS03_11510 [Bacteroidales bacterium]|jgi:hypothetical protein|nr:hypothetical protein [Bacteroidales bacterium]